jgi:hypothetical protein
MAKSDSLNAKLPLVEGEDYYLENGLMVFTARFHLSRGYCCGSGCRHCPYAAAQKRDSKADIDDNNATK